GDVVAQDGGEAVEIAFLVCDGDQPPVAVAGGLRADVDCGEIWIRRLRTPSLGSDHAGERNRRNRQKTDAFHTRALPSRCITPSIDGNPRRRENVARGGRTMRESQLVGQTVVVIGGSAGIGLETARIARAEGADVILTAR